jgi:subtilisin family serine protease
MPRQRHIDFLLLAVIIFFINVSAAIGVMNPDGMPPSFVGYMPASIMVKFDQAALGRIDRLLTPSGRTGVPAVDQLARYFGVAAIKRQFPAAKKRFLRGRAIDLSGWHEILFQTDVDIEKVVAAFKLLDDVVEAEPIGIHAVQQIPYDTFYLGQWHLNQIDAPEAWDFETGNAAIVVAVLDTGVRWFHRDLGGSDAVYFDPPVFNGNIADLHGADGNLWINPGESNQVFGDDDDDNTFEDDLIGWDFVAISQSQRQQLCDPNEDCQDADNDPRDFDGHGTHVAGIIAALNNNGQGVSSPAGGWQDGTPKPIGNGVKIMALRIGWTHKDGGGVVSLGYAASALVYAADNGARIANASWGSSEFSLLAEAVDYFLADDGLLFHAAGNDGVSDADYLGRRDDVINVAATSPGDCKTGFSNYGTWVDIAAPGLAILSTWHDNADPSADNFAWLSGTSMASPLAAGVAALIWSQNPLWTAEQVKLKLLDSTEYIDDLDCDPAYPGQLGSGRVNAHLAVGSCEGDLDGDGDVDGDDLVELIADFGCTAGCLNDLSYDGVIDSGDVDVFAKDFARKGCP